MRTYRTTWRNRDYPAPSTQTNREDHTNASPVQSETSNLTELGDANLHDFIDVIGTDTEADPMQPTANANIGLHAALQAGNTNQIREFTEAIQRGELALQQNVAAFRASRSDN